VEPGSHCSQDSVILLLPQSVSTDSEGSLNGLLLELPCAASVNTQRYCTACAEFVLVMLRKELDALASAKEQ